MKQQVRKEGHRSDGAGKLYVHVASLLRRNIRESIWGAGFKLPALDTLAEEYGVSIVTLRQAVMLLEQEGLLRRLHGKGTFVTSEAGAREWLRLDTTWDGIIQFYATAAARIRIENLKNKKRIPLPGNLLLGAGIETAPLYRYMQRIIQIDGISYALSDVYLDEDIFRRAPKAFEKDLALKVLNALSPSVVGEAHQLLLITSSDSMMAAALEIPTGVSIAEIHRSVRNPSGRLIYYSIMHYRADLIQIKTRLK